MEEFRARVHSNLPKALFYLGLFFFIAGFFGRTYGFIAAVTGSAFNFYYEKKLTIPEILLLVCGQILACAAACIASLNVVLRVILNACFPFLWTCLHSSPFNSTGYYVGVIAFAYVQLISFQPEDILHILWILTCTSAILIIVLWTIRVCGKKAADYSAVRKGLQELSQRIRAGRTGRETQRRLLDIEQDLYRKAYTGHNFISISRGSQDAYYAFALMFQRAAYYFTAEAPERAESDETTAGLSAGFADFLETAADRMNTENNGELTEKAEALLKKARSCSGQFGSFYRNFLRLFIMALKKMEASPDQKEHFHLYRYFYDLIHHMELNAFGARFALRLSLVLTICFFVMHVAGSEHVYWLPLNAFVLMRPSYEESMRRVKNRLLGSIAGCVTAYLASMVLVDIRGAYVYFSVMIILCYLSPPGSRIQAFFVTNCAVLMASLALGGRPAAEYRLFYLAIAAALVAVTNYCFFPSTRRKKLEFELKELFRMQRSYIRILEISLQRRTSLTVLRKTLINFHLLLYNTRQDLKSFCPEPQMEKWEQFFLRLWRMVAETEQMIVYVHGAEFTEEEKKAACSFAGRMYETLKQKRLCPDIRQQLPELSQKTIFADLAKRYYENAVWILNAIPRLRQTTGKEK